MTNIHDCWGIASCPCEDCAIDARALQYEADQAHIDAPSAFETWADKPSLEVRKAITRMVLTRRISDDFDRGFEILTKEVTSD